MSDEVEVKLSKTTYCFVAGKTVEVKAGEVVKVNKSQADSLTKARRLVVNTELKSESKPKPTKRTGK